jgi:diguanylate cyclase (GGDEF)-like protein/PAS domain S-box-containing protein
VTPPDRLFDDVLDHAAAAMCLVDLSHEYRWVNGAFCTMLGRPAGLLVGARVMDVVHPDDAPRAAAAFDRLLRGTAHTVRERLRYHRPDGVAVWAELAAALLPGPGARLALVHQLDVTETQLMTDALAFRAMHDDLTGLANRALLRDRLAASLASAGRHGSRGVAMFLDVDDFKQVNDRYGHAAGDRVLREIAARVVGVVRAADTVARFGGDEFVVTGEVSGPHEAHQLAARIEDALVPPVPWGSLGLPITVSVGIALSAHGDSPDDFLARADLSLLATKRLRRHRPITLDPVTLPAGPIPDQPAR